MEIPAVQLIESEHHELQDDPSLLYQHVEYLGHGYSAIVEKVRDSRTQSVYARKVTEVYLTEDLETFKQKWQKEIDILHRLQSHHHIVHVFASYVVGKKFALIMEPAANGGNLDTFLAEYNGIQDVEKKANKKKILYRSYGCLATGLAFMHQHKIRHKDIKPQNILLHNDSVIFADFGIASDFSHNGISSTNGKPEAFTRKYCAPEVSDWDIRNSKSDVYSLGCVYLLVHGTMFPEEVAETWHVDPYYMHLEELLDGLDKVKDPSIVLGAIKRMLQVLHSDRPSSKEVMDHLRQQERTYFCEQCQTCPPPDSASSPNRECTMFDSSVAPASVDPDFSQEVNSPTSSESSDDEEIYRQPPMQFGYTDSKATAARLRDIDARVEAKSVWYTMERTPEIWATRPDSADLQYPYSSQLVRQDTSRRSVVTDHSIRLPSALEKLGIHQQTTVRTMRHQPSNASQTTDTREEMEEAIVLYEDHTVSWESGYLGYGLQFRRRRPLSPLPSLRIFPLVPDLMHWRWTLFDEGSVSDVQQALTTGKLHPYTRDTKGRSLLHIAAEAGRLDLTQLLYALGVKPSLTHSGQSIFAAAASILRHDIGGPETSIELFHYILQTVDPATDFDNPSWTRQDYKELWHWQMGEWLWRQRDYVNADISSLSEICLRCLLRHMWDYTMYRADQAAAILKEYLTPDILRRIERNELTFLDDLFWNSGRNLLAERRRFHIGRFWLDNLEAAGVHIDNYLRHELDAHPGRLIIGKTYLECDLLIQMGWTREGGYRLGWEYEFDHTTGGAVVLAFAEMCVHCDDGEWPYVDWDHDDDIIAKEERTEERFDRRMEKKARRLEKMGRRTEKSSAMPGSWID